VEYWIFSDGARAVTSNGASLVFDSETPPPEPPVGLEKILSVRSLIDDPVGCAAAGITYASVMPNYIQFALGAFVTTGDGVYYRRDETGWTLVKTMFADAVIGNTDGGIYGAAVAMIARIIANANPRNYLTSYSTGGQSFSYPSFSEYLQHYKDLQAAIMAALGKAKRGWANPDCAEVGAYV